MIQKLQSPLVAAVAGCLVYLVVMAMCLKPSKFSVMAATANAVTKANLNPDTEPSWRFQNPDMDQWIEETKREKSALALRQQQLDELQKRLDAERQEIFAVTQTVHQLQTEFDSNVVRINVQEVDNLRKQAKVIATMSPEGAAAMMMEMPDDEIVRLLFMMKTDEVSLILDTLSKQGKVQAKRAANLTEMMRRTLPPAATAPRPTTAG